MPLWWEQLRDMLSMRDASHERLPDLRGLDATRVRLTRTRYLVNDRERQHTRRRLYVLRRQRLDERDPDSIGVYARGRNVGFLPRPHADRIAPFLDRVGGAAIVDGLGALDESSRLWIDLPTAQSLDRFTSLSST